MSTAYGISWIYSEFTAVRLKFGKCINKWIAPYPVNDLDDFNKALSSATKALKMNRGGDIAIAYESDEHEHIFLDIPPMSVKDIELFLGRQVIQEKKFDDTAAWGYRIIRHNDEGEGVMLHMMPHKILEAIHRICKQNHLILRRLVALTDIMALHYEKQEKSNEKVSLLIALFETHVQLVVISRSGEVLFVRELGFHWQTENLERLKTDMDRTLLYAKQRHSVLVTHISILGVDAQEATQLLSPHFDVPLSVDSKAILDIFWATTVSALPRRITSNLMPPSMRRTITSQHLRKFGAWATMTTALTSLSTVCLVEFFVQQHGVVSNETLAVIETLEQKKSFWQDKNVELVRVQSRISALGTDVPAIPLWFMMNLDKLISEETILSKAKVNRENDHWNFLLEGAIKSTLAESATILEQLEERLSSNPWNAQISKSSQDNWLQQLSEGAASKSGLISFNVNGVMQ